MNKTDVCLINHAATSSKARFDSTNLSNGFTNSVFPALLQSALAFELGRGRMITERSDVEALNQEVWVHVHAPKYLDTSRSQSRAI